MDVPEKTPIQIPMKIYGELPEPGSLDWALVVPSYREGVDVFSTLHRGLTQKDVDPSKIAIFVIVNNARDASAEVLASNAETIALVRLLQWKPTFENVQAEDAAAFEMARKIDPKGFVNTAQMYKEAAASQVRLVLIDLSTEGHALEECNVGWAKDIGGRMATDALKDDGVLTITDADTLISPRHASAVLDSFEKDPDLAGLRTIYRTYGNDEEAVCADEIDHHRDTLYFLSHDLVRFTALDYKPEPFMLMSGPNINVRARIFKELGGLEHISGAEDMTFSMKMLDRGHKISRHPDLSYYSKIRASDRTAENCGEGQRVIRDLAFKDDYGKADVLTFEQHRFVDFLSRGVQCANIVAKDEETWRRMVKMAAPSDVVLDDEDVDALWAAKMKAPNVNETLSHWYLLMCIDDIAEKRLKKSTLAQESAAMYERFKSSDLIPEQIRVLATILDEAIGKLYSFSSGVLAIQDGFDNNGEPLDVHALPEAIRFKHVLFMEGHNVLSQILRNWRQYEKKVAFFEGLRVRLEGWMAENPDCERLFHIEGLAAHLYLEQEPNTNWTFFINQMLKHIELKMARALITPLSAFLKVKLDFADSSVEALSEDPKNADTVAMMRVVNNLYHDLTDRTDSLTAQLVDNVKFILQVPHVALVMRSAEFLTQEEYGKFIQYSTLTTL